MRVRTSKKTKKNLLYPPPRARSAPASMAAQTASPRARAESSASPRSPKASDDWVISAKISSLSYGELKAIAYRHPGLIYNPHLTEKVRLFLAMELGLQRMALDTIATLRVSPYETSEEGVTILHLACAKGFAKILSLFQERKADLEAANERGETPLFVAAQAGHADIVEQLVKAGCRATTTNAHGVSALQVAALSGHLSVVQVCIAQFIALCSASHSPRIAATQARSLR